MADETIIDILPKHRLIIEAMLRGEDGIGLYYDLYDCKDRHVAATNLADVLKRPDVDAYYTKRRKDIAKAIERRTNASVLRTLLELSCIGYSDPLNVLDEKGSIRKMHQMDEQTRRSIASIKVREHYGEVMIDGKPEKQLLGYTTELKFWNKNTALRTMAEHFQMLKIDPTQLPDGSVPQEAKVFVVPAFNRRVSLPIAKPAGSNGNGNGNGASH